MGIPLLFTTVGTPTRVVVPFPGLYPSDELFPGDDVYPDDGPTLDFYVTPPDVGAFGLTISVDPVEVVFSGAVAILSPAGPGTGAAVDSGALGAIYAGRVPVGGDDLQLVAVSGETTISVDPVPAVFSAPVPTFSGLPTVVLVDPVPVTFSMDVPQTSGGLFLILVPPVRELPPLRLSIDVETPSGRHFRWGEDESNPVNVPAGLRFSDTMPGGFESQDVTLPRKPGMGGADLERLSTITVHSASGQIVWQGRLERAPRTSGDQVSVSPSAVGYQAALDDDKSASMVYIDTDMSKWRGASHARQLVLDNANFTVSDTATEPDLSGAPSMAMTVNGHWDAPKKPMVETWYDAGSGGIGQVVFTPSYSTSVIPGPWALVGLALTSDGASGVGDTTGNVFQTTAQVSLSTSAARRFAAIQWFFQTTPSGADGTDYIAWLQAMAVIGAHGLPIRINPDLGAGGFFASDIVRHAVSRWAPGLTVNSTTVQQSGFVLSQAAFFDPTTAGDIVKQVTRFGLQDWAVWDDRTFWWGDRGINSRQWRARIGPSQLSETGPQIDRLWNSTIVQYTDVDGSTRMVGPPGSGADTQDPSLVDVDPENPANEAGVTRRNMLQMGTSTPRGAIEVGRRFLEEQKLLDTSGQARFVGHVESDRGVVFPYHAVRAGDTVSFVDASDTSARRVVKTDKDHASKTCTVDLDSPPEGLQALLERLGVVLVDLGLS